jgi:hypothetical protein
VAPVVKAAADFQMVNAVELAVPQPAVAHQRHPPILQSQVSVG